MPKFKEPMSRDQEYLARYPQGELDAAWDYLIGKGLTPLMFGFYVEVEKTILRNRLLAQGETDELRLYLGVSAAYTDAHKNDETFAVWQARRKAQYPPAPTPVRLAFTKAELEHILERFSGANDLTGQAIAEKVVAALNTGETA
jgi:hypothetical protein